MSVRGITQPAANKPNVMLKWTPQGFYQHALEDSMVTSDQFCLVCWEDDDWHRFYPKKFGEEFRPVGVDSSGFELYSDASATRWDPRPMRAARTKLPSLRAALLCAFFLKSPTSRSTAEC